MRISARCRARHQRCSATGTGGAVTRDGVLDPSIVVGQPDFERAEDLVKPLAGDGRRRRGRG